MSSEYFQQVNQQVVNIVWRHKSMSYEKYLTLHVCICSRVVIGLDRHCSLSLISALHHVTWDCSLRNASSPLSHAYHVSPTEPDTFSFDNYFLKSLSSWPVDSKLQHGERKITQHCRGQRVVRAAFNFFYIRINQENIDRWKKKASAPNQMTISFACPSLWYKPQEHLIK